MGKKRYRALDIEGFDGTVELRDSKPTYGESKACMGAFMGMKDGDDENPVSVFDALEKLSLICLRGLDADELNELDFDQALEIFKEAMAWFVKHTASMSEVVQTLGGAVTLAEPGEPANDSE
ncbi:MAG: hypothetical protein JRL30_01130 [Deltaproteobacteria bacterium]|nr:hypothetical protein [Deltaproteobacteria bacterium]